MQRRAKTGVGQQTNRALFWRHMEECILSVQILLCGNKAQLLQVPQTSRGVSKKTTVEGWVISQANKTKKPLLRLPNPPKRDHVKTIDFFSSSKWFDCMPFWNAWGSNRACYSTYNLCYIFLQNSLNLLEFLYHIFEMMCQRNKTWKQEKPLSFLSFNYLFKEVHNRSSFA